jgi:hypothetical protein
MEMIFIATDPEVRAAEMYQSKDIGRLKSEMEIQRMKSMTPKNQKGRKGRLTKTQADDPEAPRLKERK